MEIWIAQCLETWQINQRVNVYLLDAIPPEGLTSVLPSGRTRTVARMFVHLHHMRLQRIEVSAPELLGRLTKFARKDAALDQKRLKNALEQSGEAIAQLIEIGLEKGKIKGYRPHPIGFLGYMISHEAHHRGEICVALTESGHKLDDAVLYGQWDWSQR